MNLQGINPVEYVLQPASDAISGQSTGRFAPEFNSGLVLCGARNDSTVVSAVVKWLRGTRPMTFICAKSKG